ncbi:MAG: hypothetical protein R2699_16305 [Acidimicrobiales bacterium]
MLLFATVSSEVLYVPLLLAATLALVRALNADRGGSRPTPRLRPRR